MIKTSQKTEKTAPIPAADGLRHAAALMSVMEELGRVMNQEVTLLDKRAYGEIEALKIERARWMREYHLGMAAIAQKPELLKAVPAEERRRLREKGEAFVAIVQNYSGRLKAAVTATQALVQTVMDAAREQNKASDCYADPRKSPLMLGSYSPTCAPVAINQTA